eukprot:gnl/MRDRNA2_/MRDRNA2_153208_c0_seq1.p1 gnl/MRDRNA2_/MRDRNA2_153208_c0~~gnl/MRDRNA2_/MRDRNA2_153208_c0_seq1.p1  ORF type:complete len:182 (+),score=30.58 gnl/MRDRNA2_/MRDRNA2_153208_c0_seq1:137-682(+)
MNDAAEEPAESSEVAAQPSCPLPLGNSPSTESIVAWSSCDIFLREKFMMHEPGRLFYWGIPRNVDARVHEMLQPIFSHINRDDHAERYGFLFTTRAMIRRCGYDATDDCSGCIRMYISHFPCISCVAIFCQFIRFFPGVRLEMDFDNMWKTRFDHGRKDAKPDAWKIFDVQEGCVADLEEV